MKVKLKSLAERSAYRQPVSKVRGSILVVSLWALCLLSSFAIILGYNIRQKVTLVQRLNERAVSREIGEAAIRRAAVEVASSLAEQTVVDFSGSWSNNPDVFRKAEIGSGFYTISYVRGIDPKKKIPIIWYGLTDEQSKININKAPRQVLKRLFQETAGVSEMNAQGLAASIVDWRDEDSNLSSPQGSAEDEYYRGLLNPYESKDSEFQVLDELLLVRGINMDIFNKIKKFVTVYGSGRVNINTAPKEVLVALGLNNTLAGNIINYRHGQDGLDGTGDDNTFSAKEAIAPQLSRYLSLGSFDLAQLDTVIDQSLGVNSDYFGANISVSLFRQTALFNAVGVINRAGKVVYWQEP